MIISNESRGKNITTYISNSLNIEYYFQKIRELEINLEEFIIQMSITPKVFWLEKRNFRNGRTSALKWHASRMHRIKIMDFTDQNVLLVKGI